MLLIIAESMATEVIKSASDPYWVSLITGSGGALIVLMMWVKSLSASNKRLEEENRDISRQSIECITKILERQDQEKSTKATDRAEENSWRQDLRSLMERICSRLDIDGE